MDLFGCNTPNVAWNASRVGTGLTDEPAEHERRHAVILELANARPASTLLS